MTHRINIVASTLLITLTFAFHASASAPTQRPALRSAPGATATSGYRDMYSRAALTQQASRSPHAESAGYRDMLIRFPTHASTARRTAGR